MAVTMTDPREDEVEDRVKRARLARKEGRQTIENQTDTVSDIDDKAIRLFRVNLVIAGILATGLSIVVSADAATYGTLLTPYTFVGVAGLFLSTVFAGLTYTSTAMKIGVDPEAIRESILTDRYDYDLVEEEIALNYAEMIQYNYEKNASNVLLFTLTLLSAIWALVYFGIAVLDIYASNGIHPAFNVPVVTSLLIVGKFSGISGTTERWWRLTTPKQRLCAWLSAVADRARYSQSVRRADSRDEDS